MELITWVRSHVEKYTNLVNSYVNGIMKYIADAKYIIEERDGFVLLHTKPTIGYIMKDKFAQRFETMEQAKEAAERTESTSTVRWLGASGRPDAKQTGAT